MITGEIANICEFRVNRGFSLCVASNFSGECIVLLGCF